MSGWWTDPADGPTGIRRHRMTDATNMREHRKAKRVQADIRNATTQPERRSRKAEWAALAEREERRYLSVGLTTPSRKRSRQKRRKSAEERLAAHERATREWLDRHGPGVDF